MSTSTPLRSIFLCCADCPDIGGAAVKVASLLTVEATHAAVKSLLSLPKFGTGSRGGVEQSSRPSIWVGRNEGATVVTGDPGDVIGEFRPFASGA